MIFSDHCPFITEKFGFPISTIDHRFNRESHTFFKNHAAPVVIKVIKENDPQKMRKLFNLLNEIYDDGTNEIQSIIAVTVLGELNNDQDLLANCVDYMSADMISPVVQVNKYLAKSKSARMRLENPPKYKPKKKKKKKNMFSTLTNQ